MMEERLLNMLADQEVLFDAYAASSAYVMHKAFDGIEELQAFRGRKELAPTLLKHLDKLSKEPTDPVVLGAHLYALTLTGEKERVSDGVRHVLKSPALRRDPMVGQMAAHEGALLLRMHGPQVEELSFEPQQVETILKRLEDKEVH